MGVNLPETVIGVNPPEPTPPSTGNQPELFNNTGGDWQKANERYFNAVNKLGELHQSSAQANARIAQLEGVLQGMIGGQPANQSPFAGLEQTIGLPADPFERHIDEKVGKRVQEALSELFTPLMTQMQAEEQLASEIEGYDELKIEARKYMKANPEIAQTFNAVREANPIAAWKYAIREALVARGGTRPTPTHAGLPGNAAQGGRGQMEPSAAPVSAEREAAALEYGNKFGDMGAYRSERFKGTSIERAVQEALRRVGLAP